MEARLRSLTLTEARAIRLVAEGRTDAEIAERLGVAILDVERSIGDALQKLALRSRTELALLVSPPELGPGDGEA